MAFTYDFHIHSCLSPCGDDEMTPANLVNMAAILELDVIALTDHNTTGNCRSAIAAGARCGVLVLPGMELCTAEEAHVVCLFADPDRADDFDARVRPTLPPVPNRPKVFGNQRLMDSTDQILGHEETLLVTASGITVDEVAALCRGCGGFCYPAHIDRSSFSVLSALGAIAPEWGFSCAEVTPRGNVEQLRAQHPALRDMHVLRSSDAHDLESFALSEPAALNGLDAAQGLRAQDILDLLRAL